MARKVKRRTSKRRHTESTFQRGYISGVDEAVKKLRAKGEEVLLAAKSALKDGVDLIVADAKSRCPVDTGKLKDSVKAVDLEQGAAYELSANATNAKKIAYGQFVEFSPKINKPFLYPAVDANINYVKNNIKQAVESAIAGRNYGNSAA